MSGTRGALGDLGIINPVLAAPMAGGPSTPALVIAAAKSDSLGFLAGGYKSPAQLAAQIREVRETTSTFGVNLFVPNPLPVDPDAYHHYARSIQIEADRYGIDLVDVVPAEDDDLWHDKLELLLDDPVPVVSLTFAVPGPEVVAALRRVGTIVVQSVTSPEEARLAAAAGVDALAVQGSEAGGHSATMTPRHSTPLLTLPQLIRSVRDAVDLPLIAAGGIATAKDVASVLREGADAAMVGTALLRTFESGASETYKSALVERRDRATIVTRAFTGRPARALPNRFTTTYDALAPLGYPAIHHLTNPLRRAATLAGDGERINIWAGAGHSYALEEPVAEALGRLAELA